MEFFEKFKEIPMLNLFELILNKLKTKKIKKIN